MTNRLARSVPFWVLVLASLASIGFGLWIVLSKIAAMSSTLADGSATYEQVYVNPVWIGFGGVFVGAGIVGLLLVLTLAALRSALPTPVTEAAVVEETVIVEAAPVTDEAPVFEDADVETSTTDAAPPAAAAEAAAQADSESPAHRTHTVRRAGLSRPGTTRFPAPDQVAATPIRKATAGRQRSRRTAASGT